MFERYVAVQFYEPEDAPGNFELCSHLDFGHPTVESITLKRFKSVEKDGGLYPTIDIACVDGIITESQNGNGLGGSEAKAIYRVLQTLEPKIDTPSLPDPGYLLFAFKTMEDMSTNFFLNQWKTWTGARLFRSALEPHIPMGRISFLKRTAGELDFIFMLLVEMPTFKIHGAPILNVLNMVRQRINAFTGCYRAETFKISTEIGGKLIRNQLRELTSEIEPSDEFLVAKQLRLKVSNNIVKIVSDGVDLGDECRLVDLNLHIFDENGNGIEPPEPAPNLFLKITEATQTEDDKIRDEGTQTEKFVQIDRQISPMTESRRNSFCSLPRSPAIQDLAGLFEDGPKKPKESAETVKNESKGTAKRNSTTHVHFWDEHEETWDRLSAELDGYLQKMLRESRPKASPPPMRCAAEDSEQFFRKLREKYFRSPDFPREERHRTVVLVNNT